MLTRTSRLNRRVKRVTIAAIVALLMLLTSAYAATATDTLGGPTQYRDCWLGNWERYSDCVDANTWGTRFLFPDPDDASLVIDGIPSY